MDTDIKDKTDSAKQAEKSVSDHASMIQPVENAIGHDYHSISDLDSWTCVRFHRHVYEEAC